MPAPDAVKRLVDRFDQDRKVFLSPDYKEEQLRAEFLNPFFESLGWDVANKAGLTAPKSSSRSSTKSQWIMSVGLASSVESSLIEQMTGKRAFVQGPRDLTGSYLWYWVGGTWFAAFATLAFISPHYTKESAHYLLSTLPQCLSAVLALTLTLPLAFASLSGYMIDELQRMVRHRVFVLYPMLYAASILFSTALLRWKQPVDWSLDIVLSFAAACLTSLWLFAWWVAGRLQPSAYIERLMVRFYALATREPGTKEPIARWLRRALSTPVGVFGATQMFRWNSRRREILSDEGYSELSETTSQVIHVARMAIRNGATRYLDVVTDRLLRYWILGSLDNDFRLSSQAERALELIVPASAGDVAVSDFVMKALQGFFVLEYVRGVDLTEVPLDRIRALERMLRFSVAPRMLDEPQWSAACTALWTIVAVLQITPLSKEATDALWTGRELATFTRFWFADALKARISNWKSEHPEWSREELANEAQSALECVPAVH